MGLEILRYNFTAKGLRFAGKIHFRLTTIFPLTPMNDLGNQTIEILNRNRLNTDLS